MENNIQGVVNLEFVIDNTCTITDIKVVKGLGYGLDEIAIKMIEELEKQLKIEHRTWCTTSSTVKLPILFRLK